MRLSRSDGDRASPPHQAEAGTGDSPILPSLRESPRGRTCTCVDPLRRRRPELLGHAEKWQVRPELHRHYSAFEARATGFCRRTQKWSPCQELHLELDLRTVA